MGTVVRHNFYLSVKSIKLCTSDPHLVHTAVPECLSGDNLSVSCPRLSPDGSVLIYLQGKVFGPHNQCLCVQQVQSAGGVLFMFV